jgi:hypothetical protein
MNSLREQNWRLWLTGLLLALALFYGGRQLSHFLRGSPPAGMTVVRRTSPALDRGSAPDLAWNRFHYLWEETKREAAARKKPIGSILFLELTAHPKEAIAWTTETLVNPGFAPKSNFERPLGGRHTPRRVSR